MVFILQSTSSAGQPMCTQRLSLAIIMLVTQILPDLVCYSKHNGFNFERTLSRLFVRSFVCLLVVSDIY